MRFFSNLFFSPAVLLFGLITGLTVLSTQALQLDPWLYADWVQTQTGLCLGHYQEPPFELVTPDTQRIQFDEGTFNATGWSELEGHVQIHMEEAQANAQRGRFYRNTQRQISEIQLNDQVSLRRKGIQVFSSQATWWPLERRTTLDHAQYHLYERSGRGSAARITQRPGQPDHFENADYTTCAPQDNSWHVTADTLDLDHEKSRANLSHVRLYFGNTPVFYSPYLSFPLSQKRQSGWLNPGFHQDSETGNSLIVPYYWNINPQLDATLSPFITAERGWGIAQEWRYANSRNLSAFTIGFIPHDRKFARDQTLEQADLSPFTDPLDPRRRLFLNATQHRYSFSGLQSFQFNPHWSGYWAYQSLSDENVWEDYHSVFSVMPLSTPTTQGSHAPSLQWTLPDRTTLIRRAELHYDAPGSHALFNLNAPRTLYRFNRPLLNEPYHTFPQLLWEKDWTADPMNTRTWLSWTRFDHVADPLSGLKPTTGHRTHLAPTVTWPIESTWGYFTPEWTADLRHYDLHVNPNDAYAHQAHFAIPISSLDTGLIFERETLWHNQTYTHTLEPSLFFLSIPNVNQSNVPIFDASPYGWDFGSLTRTNRYSGEDRVGDAQQISWRIRTRFLHTKNALETASFGIGQILYGRQPSIQLPGEPVVNNKRSPLIGQARYHFNPSWILTLEHAYDTQLHTPIQSRAYFDYQNASRTKVQSEYLYIYRGDPQINDLGEAGNLRQWNTSLTFPLNQHFSLWGFWRYDLAHQRILERFVGLGYESCCWALRGGVEEERLPLILGNRRVHHFFVQFALTGLTGFGNGFHDYMNTRLSGWKDTFGHLR